jgi:titin
MFKILVFFKIQYLEQPRVTQTQEEGFTTQAPAFTCSMRDVQIVEGMPAHFEAKLVPVGDPRLRVDWYKDGRPIQVKVQLIVAFSLD